MRRISQTFTVHPVGQGLFYSGVIKFNLDNNEKTFRFVFDCGSVTSNAGKEEVDRFRHEDFSEETDRLDLLVISHFDADHVNLIKKLLATKRKVNKIVMPFIDFEERFFLVLRFLENKIAGTIDDDDIGTILLILNPLDELRPHLDDDDDTNVFIVTSDPDTPAGGERIEEGSSNDFTPENSELEFGFKRLEVRLATEEIASLRYLSDLGLMAYNKIGIIKDSITAYIHFKSLPQLAIMEFVFYRRQIGRNEKRFYEEVFNAFCRQYNINKNDKGFIEKLIEILKSIKGATAIKKCYKEAKSKCEGIKIAKRDILNMNTTALCMLHRNLKKIHSIFGRIDGDNNGFFDFNINRTEKVGSVISVFPDWHLFKRYYHPFYYHRKFDSRKTIPNVMLTSDTYSKTPEEVEAFLNKYRNYQGNYWLFQVSHHGSKNNSDRQLFTRLPSYVTKFINYGVRHQLDKKFRHPDKELISELIASGHANSVVAITEYAGLSFEYAVERS